ncbi:MAG TPA: tetratricopeptide repeat protein [Kofleriaceae bacterium]|nr:tetratricopeptide repeat protein [Kofleriaceae bacterium]
MEARVRGAAILFPLITSAIARAGGLEPDDLPPPQPEVVGHPARVEPPAIPPFTLPVGRPGFHGPRELRVRGAPLLGTKLKVEGYVTWIYDCAEALARTQPHKARADLLVSIDEDPRQCERPRFYLGDTPNTPSDVSIWIVDVPRKPAKPERFAMTNEERHAWPAVPKLAIGDHVVVTGTWATESPHGERNTTGLLVYEALEHVLPGADPPTRAAPAAPPAVEAPEPVLAVAGKPPMHRIIDTTIRNRSVDHLNACTRANAAGLHERAIAECQAAAAAWDENHLAWYGLASAHIARHAWVEARDAAERAVALRPDRAMYQLYHGLALYEAERERARGRAVSHQDHEAGLDASQRSVQTLDAQALEAAHAALWRAARLAPELWRAHYYLGRVYIERDEPARAAEQLGETVRHNPGFRPGYIALIELYRQWDYLDQALAVAMLGIAHVAQADAGQLWDEAGMVHAGRRADGPALEAFTRAIAANPGDAAAKLGRGQVYFRKGDLASARRDLEAVAGSKDPALAPIQPFVVQLLQLIARKEKPPEMLFNVCRGRTIDCRKD